MTRQARVQGDIILNSSLFVPCLLVGEKTEEGLPRPFTPSFLSPLMNLRDYDDRILVVPTTGLIIILIITIKKKNYY